MIIENTETSQQFWTDLGTHICYFVSIIKIAIYYQYGVMVGEDDDELDRRIQALALSETASEPTS